MATQRFYDGQPGPDIRRELNNFETILDGTVAAAQDASTDAISASVKAQQWADAAPGVEVETGKYSAKHWADRAQTTVTGGIIYRGAHSAASGAYPATPSLGDYYKISAAGTLGGVNYSVGDSIIYNGTDWDKIDSTDAVTSVAGRVGEVVLTKGDVGLSNVDNTSDVDKPVSTATQTALNGKANLASPSFTGNVVAKSSPESTGIAALSDSNPGFESRAQGIGGTAGAATIAFHRPAVHAVHFGIDTDNKLKVGGGSLGANAYTIYHENNKPTKADVGLGNVDNTSDAGKPVSTAQAAAIAARYGKNNVLGTVSQSAGVPTGAVIERGSNANGTYVRFADGTQICTLSSTFTAAAEVVWTFPATFAASPNYLSASVNHSAEPRYYNVDAAITGGNISATIYRSVRETRAPVADAFAVCVMAVGRWF